MLYEIEIIIFLPVIFVQILIVVIQNKKIDTHPFFYIYSSTKSH